MILVLVCFISFLHCGFANAPECCSKVTNSECRNACMQLSPTATQVEQISYLASVANFCPANFDEFWQCAGQSLTVLEEMVIFAGRPCCNFTKSRLCREACVQAESEQDIETHCSRSTEDKLYDCIARLKDGEKCCSRSSDSNPNCMSTCWHMYLSNSLTIMAKKHLREMCKGGDRGVYQCVQKQTQSTQTNSLHCCEKAETDSCKQHCVAAFKKHDDDNDILDMVEEGCGIVDITRDIYQCFLKEKTPKSDVTAIDAAKLHCCEKATSNMCADMCVKTHMNEWSSIGRFEKNCGYLSSPVATMETLMHDCLKEVEEPCQLGCSGLSYCTNFNNRPTEHFRSCTQEADLAARSDFLDWQKGTISLPRKLFIPVKDVRNCEPEMWKAIACSLQIKPCNKTPTPLQICREDCEYILGQCVDNTKLKSEGKVMKDLCNRLPKTDTEACISVQKYLTESPHKMTQHEATQPCKSNPCGKDEICHVQRRKCKHSKSCPHFVCRKACKMGYDSKLLVPQSTNVIIPEYLDNKGANGCQVAYKICHCGHKGSIGHCRQVSQCIRKKHCVISTGVVKAHREYFKSDCNDCVCFDGKQVCTKRACPSQLKVNTIENVGLQNCDCLRIYEPVCASNGKTYPSACIARCVGQEEFQMGSCHSIDPCHSSPCQEGFLCVPHRKVCSGPRYSPCDQYQCISPSEECNHHHHDPVCDTRKEEFVNICVLLSKSRRLEFRGHCPVNDCSRSGTVCGHNGETYSSECAALADRTTVDYTGPCHAFGQISGDGEEESVCEDVECPEVVPANCEGIIPPWGCCPVCAAVLRTLSSDALAQMVAMTIKKGPITVGDIVKTLSNMVTVSECDVFGYLSLEGDIIIMVAAITQNPTSLQIQACFKEAERFEYLIQSRSPTITSNMLLTPLLYAPLRTPVMSITDGVTNCTPSSILVLTLLILLLSHKILGFV